MYKATAAIAIVLTMGVVLGASSTVGATGNRTLHDQVEVVCEAPNVLIEKGTVKRGEKGSEHQLTSMDVVNGTYEVTVISTNQNSVHPNSDILVRSHKSVVKVNDVESESFERKTAEGKLVVEDGNIKVSVVLGQDEVFSGGVCVELKKIPEPTLATTPTPTPQSAPVHEHPQTLPATGATYVVAMTAAVSGMGYGAHRLATRKK